MDKDIRYFNALKKDKRILKKVINRLFTFGELDKELSGLDYTIGNFNCPFHPSEGHGINKSQSARAYYNEDEDIYTICCYTVRKSYTCFEYIERVLEKDPYEYLIKYKSKGEILEIVKYVESGYIELDKNFAEQRINYIDNIFFEADCNTIDYIEHLFTD